MDDRLNRRQALAGMGSVSLGALLTACGADRITSTSAEVTTTDGSTATVEPASGKDLSQLFEDTSACTLTAEETEGPYYFDVDSIRSDIREDREGVPLRLVVRVRDAAACEPLENAVVDIWHCDAGGTYSGFEDGAGKTFLRGAQATDRDGIVEMTTIYPGSYPGRTVHIHAKVHLDKTTVLTTQLYFPEDITSGVYEQTPYASDADRTTSNETDGIFDESLVLAIAEDDEGYLGTISFDVETA